MIPAETYFIPEAPDFLLDETPVSAEIRARAAMAAAAAARSAHLAVLHPTHTTMHGKKDKRRLPAVGRATLTEADPAHRVTLHPIRAAHAGILADAGYVSLQRHAVACRSDDLAVINAYAWADLEIGEGDAFWGMDPEEVAGIVLARHDAAGVPRPSIVTFSGRGLWFVYLAADHIPPQAKGRVLKACRAYWGEEIKTGRAAGTERVVAKATTLRSLWEGGRIDWSVGDMSRVHRLAGSVNDRSGETVRLVWPASFDDVQRTSFDDFTRAVLPFSREEMRAYRDERSAARETRQARAEAEGRAVTSFARQARPGRWAVVASEIEALIRHHAGAGAVSPALGLRNLLAHHLCCAWALSGRGGDARGWAAELAPLLCGPKLSEKALATYLRPIEKNLRRHEAGETDTYTPPGGEPRHVSPLYEYGIGRIVDSLGITRELAAELGFRILTPAVGDRKALTAKERMAAMRARQGAKKKTEMDRQAQERAERLIELLGQGIVDDKELAARLGCCERTLRRIYDRMFAGACDNVVIDGLDDDEDVSDADLHELVTACTQTDALRYLSGGSATPACHPLATAQPQPIEVSITPAKPGKAPRKPKTGKAKAKPENPAWPPHGPLQRLLALYEHMRSVTREYRSGEAEWQDMASAAMVLDEEMRQGRRMHHAPAKPRDEAKLRQRLARLRIDTHTYLPCDTQVPRLH